MRITGGLWRSRRLRGPGKGLDLRPTPDALRERAFAILGHKIDGVRFLDLFAGTGAVGLEALSRGASQVLFVERHRPAARLIRTNCEALGVSDDQARIIARSALQVVPELARREEVFNIVWADPPFESWHEGLQSIELAFSTGVVSADGIGCLECPEKAKVELSPSLGIERDLKGGASRLVMITAS